MSITCAGDPFQKCLWGTLGAQVNDTKNSLPSLKYLQSTLCPQVNVRKH